LSINLILSANPGSNNPYVEYKTQGCYTYVYPKLQIRENDNAEKLYIDFVDTIVDGKICLRELCPMLKDTRIREISVFAALDLDYIACPACKPVLFFFPSHNEMMLLDNYKKLSPNGKDLLIKNSKNLVQEEVELLKKFEGK